MGMEPALLPASAITELSETAALSGEQDTSSALKEPHSPEQLVDTLHAPWTKLIAK
jgi:hypothetical protein